MTQGHAERPLPGSSLSRAMNPDIWSLLSTKMAPGKQMKTVVLILKGNAVYFQSDCFVTMNPKLGGEGRNKRLQSCNIYAKGIGQSHEGSLVIGSVSDPL